MNPCRHSHRCRYGDGFKCEDCGRFIERSSPEYRRDEEMSNAWCELHNLPIHHPESAIEATSLRDEIGIGIDHDNYEELLSRAQSLLSKYGRDFDTSVVTLRSQPNDEDRIRAYEQRRRNDGGIA